MKCLIQIRTLNRVVKTSGLCLGPHICPVNERVQVLIYPVTTRVQRLIEALVIIGNQPLVELNFPSGRSVAGVHSGDEEGDHATHMGQK
jgi:hypothetical protein